MDSVIGFYDVIFRALAFFGVATVVLIPLTNYLAIRLAPDYSKISEEEKDY